MNKRYKLILVLLIVIFIISSIMYIKEIAEKKEEKDIYEDLQEIVQDEEKSTNEIENTDNLKNETSNLSTEKQTDTIKNTNYKYNLENISKINSDVIGWIKIDGTKIDYPVMQNGDFYLHRNIYKKYSSYGTPYLAEYCDLKTSDNLVIYGHHMNDNSMFAHLEYYKNYNFYKNHKYIKFYTLENGQTVENTYEVALVFKTIAYSDNGLKYYSCTNFYDEQELNSFVNNCRNLEFYNINVKINYGDKLITLSTCEYSQKNGRMVVIAKKI